MPTYTQADGLADNAITSIAVAPDGTVWAATLGGVSRFDGRNWATYYRHVADIPEAVISSIAVAPDGTAWIGDPIEGGISSFDGETWTNYSIGGRLAGRGVEEIAVAADGVIWAATEDGLARFDGETWAAYTEADGLARNQVECVAAAPDGSVWVSTWRDAYHFDGEAWTTYSAADGLGSHVRSIAVANNGVAWFATNRGVSSYVP